jgi:16S rRNA (uracil1498-N3)-methyltransferase
VLAPDESHHAINAVRLVPGDELTIMDGKGSFARCKFLAAAEGRVRAGVLERHRCSVPTPELVVYQGAPKGHKADAVVERLAEVGVGKLRFYESTRAVARWDSSKRARLPERWTALARAAAKQSRNPFVMDTDGILTWEELVGAVREEQHAVVLWEEESEPLRSVLPTPIERIAVTVGPEGGLTEEEVAALSEVGAQPASLGSLILRTENAALVAVSALLWHFGRIG